MYTHIRSMLDILRVYIYIHILCTYIYIHILCIYRKSKERVITSHMYDISIHTQRLWYFVYVYIYIHIVCMYIFFAARFIF